MKRRVAEGWRGLYKTLRQHKALADIQDGQVLSLTVCNY